MHVKDEILARLYVALTLLALLPLLVGGQLLRIHLNDGADLRAQGVKQASSFDVIPAIRGAIYDRAGRTLAVNTARYDLALDPTISGFRSVEARFYGNLAGLLGRSADEYRSRVARRSSRSYVLLQRQLTEAQKEAVESWDVPGLIMIPEFNRRYNYPATLSHVLGHVDKDGKGLAGVELAYDEYLLGTPGRRATKLDRNGVQKPFVGGQVVQPRDGQALVLTIDLVQQSILEEELERGVLESGSAWGSAIAIDPHTGAVLAQANYPTYDSNRPGEFAESFRRNHAISDRIEPGSTFKLVTVAAAVETGAMKLSDTLDTGDGWAVFGGRTMRDTHAHGRISLEDAIVVSSNVGVAKTAQQLDAGVLYQYARNLGFGQPTWMDLPGEVAGSLKRTSSWSGTTQTSLSIGYEIEATSAQILVAYAALANGGVLVRPYVVAERRDISGNVLWTAKRDSVRRAIKRRTTRRLIRAFERVVSEGTATDAQVSGVSIAGKTGTARKVIEGRYSSTKARASFVGFFPSEAPTVAMIVVLDEPATSIYGGTVAAPIFQRVAARWLPTFAGGARSLVSADLEVGVGEDRPAPPVAGQPAAVASSRLLAAGYDVEPPPVRLASQTVSSQRPVAGTPVRRGASIRLTLAADTLSTAGTMPDLAGLSARQAAFWLRKQNVDVRIQGHGTVVTHSPPSGRPIGSKAVLRCE